MRRKWVVAGIVVMFLLFSSVWVQAAEKKGPVKIGVVLTFTGPFAVVGRTALEGGVKLALEKWNYEAGGRKIELVVEDDEGKPEMTLMKTKKLVEKDKVDIIIGPVTSSGAYAIKEYLRQQKVPLMIISAFAAGLTRDNTSPYVFRVWLSAGPSYRQAIWAYEKMGSRKAIYCAVDYAMGRETGEAYVKGFTKAGGQMVGELYAALGTKDYGPYLTQIAKLADSTGADTFFFSFAGAEAVAFVTQLDEYGLKGKFKTIACYTNIATGQTMNQIGKAGAGIYNMTAYNRHDKSPANMDFVKLYEKKFGVGKMEQMAYPGYTGTDVICKAIENVKGNVENKAAFLGAIRGIRYESPFGPFEFDQRDQDAVLNYKIFRLEWANGKTDEVLVDTIPKVQNWWWLEGKK